MRRWPISNPSLPLARVYELSAERPACGCLRRIQPPTAHSGDRPGCRCLETVPLTAHRSRNTKPCWVLSTENGRYLFAGRNQRQAAKPAASLPDQPVEAKPGWMLRPCQDVHVLNRIN